MFLIPAFSRLRNFNASAFGTPATMVKVCYAVGLILLLVGSIIIVGAVFAHSIAGIFGGIAAAFLGVVFLLIGFIGLVIGCFRLRDSFQETLFLVVGMLFIVAAILMFVSSVSVSTWILDLIAWIMIYVAVGSSIHRL